MQWIFQNRYLAYTFSTVCCDFETVRHFLKANHMISMTFLEKG